MNQYDLHPALIEDMQNKHIDIALALDILNRYNQGEFDCIEKIVPTGVPAVDGVNVVDTRDSAPQDAIYRVPKNVAKEHLQKHGLVLPTNVPEYHTHGSTWLVFSRTQLESIGRQLLPHCAYGVLNGGSATSYADLKKNKAINTSLFEFLKPAFEQYASVCHERPKGLTPAYINPDGSPGASFLELKMRARLLAANLTHRSTDGLFLPLYQMTSIGNHDILLDAYEGFRNSPFLSVLSSRFGIDPCAWMSGVQPMIAAFTHSAEGKPKRIFDRAYGKEHSSLALPGGHGQCFMVLADIFRQLHRQGIRYAMLSNVDNIGAFLDPLELGILAVSGKPAGFDFAFRTPVDVKGGILVQTAEGRKTVVDIGPAIDIEQVMNLEQNGHAILFNCASGMFDLDWLVPRLEEIARTLPMRFSDQQKDAGAYSQAEQVTWEVVSLLPDFIAFAVDKNRRFLAAKMLSEMLLTSGFGIEIDTIPAALRETGAALHKGQHWLLEHVYNLILKDGRWIPAELA